MNYSEDVYRNIINNLRTNDLQALLGAFYQNRGGRKSELKERALGLLRNKPAGLNYPAYLSKIIELNRSMENNAPNAMPIQRHPMMLGGMHHVQPSRPYQQPHQYYQQPMQISRGGFPQVMPQVQRGIYGNNFSGSNNILYNYPPARPRNVVTQVTLDQQVTAELTGSLTYDTNNANSYTPSGQSLSNIRLKKLPFYEIIAEIIKPSNLVGYERCTIANLPRGSREATFKFTLSPEHATIVAMNRDISEGKNEYIYQIQIRICLFESNSSEISDNLPAGLHIRLCNRICPLPPPAHNHRPGIESRRIARPINCSHYVKLNPSIANTISVNWIPDAKPYVLAVNLVKKLTAEKLIHDLFDKGPRSSEETKKDIIKKYADIDPDLATTSYRFSLVCPLGKTRMKLPTKSSNCNHLQCFDAETFILMNEKKPTWMCPTCNQPCLYDNLQIEAYFWEVLTNSNLPDTCKEIEILADGSWKVYEENKETSNDTEKMPIDSVNLADSDDEITVEVKKEHDAEDSKESENLSCLIDLTLSDDEELLEENNKQENEAQAADAVQPVTTENLEPLAQVQPQQAVTSSEQVIEIDCTSSPSTSPMPTTTSS